MDFFNKKYIETAEAIFLNPRKLYSWNDIVNGVRDGGGTKSKYGVAPNTARAFHRTESFKEKNKVTNDGPLAIIKRYFSENITAKAAEIASIKGRNELDKLSDAHATELKKKLSGVVKPQLLESYNLLRKPVDLYMEHLVSMSYELAEVRHALVPCLYLPLDSQIFQYSGIGDDELFSDQLLNENGLPRQKAGFSWVKDKHVYEVLQKQATKRATALSAKLGKPFHSIYFDLIWGDRSQGKEQKNLFFP